MASLIWDQMVLLATALDFGHWLAHVLCHGHGVRHHHGLLSLLHHRLLLCEFGNASHLRRHRIVKWFFHVTKLPDKCQTDNTQVEVDLLMLSRKIRRKVLDAK